MQYRQKRLSFIVVFLFMILLLIGCGNTAENAKKELHEMNIEYTADDLINAIETGNTQVVDLFEKSGFDLSLAGKNHKTPLMAAAHTGNLDLIDKVLSEYGDTVNDTDDIGLTALSYSVQAGQAEAADKLINADWKVVNHQGDTLIHLLAVSGKTACLDDCLQHGVDINMTNKVGATALDLAIKAQNEEVIDKLKAAGAKTSQQIDPYSPSQSNLEDDTAITYQINTPKGAVIVSNDNIVLHLGQSVHIMPSQDSLDPGQVRWMGSANDNMDVVFMKAAGKKHPHGSTEAIFTGKKLGTTHRKLVPDYGDWNRAAVLTFTVIE